MSDTPGLAYLVTTDEMGEKEDFLCVIADGKFHRFKIEPVTLARLAAETAHRLWGHHAFYGTTKL